MAKPELGAKQLCPNCGAKFYDLNRRPALCPKCKAEFDPEEVGKTRRVRRGPGAADYEDEETPKPAAPDTEADGYEDETDDTPEIDQAMEDDAVDPDADDEEEAASPAKPAPADDLGVDFADDEDVEGGDGDDDDVPFLEDEDEDDFSDDVDLPDEDEDRD